LGNDLENSVPKSSVLSCHHITGTYVQDFDYDAINNMTLNDDVVMTYMNSLMPQPTKSPNTMTAMRYAVVAMTAAMASSICCKTTYSRAASLSAGPATR
jgi:hypothetical protein